MEWKDAKKELPAIHGQDVLIWHEWMNTSRLTGYATVSRNILGIKKVVWRVQNFDLEPKIIKVSHWMYVPEPPTIE